MTCVNSWVVWLTSTWVIEMNDYQLSVVKQHIKFEDIAVALSRICRFGGRGKRFYSVLSHSLVVGSLIASFGPEYELAGLLHDAAEIYIGDTQAPFKTWAQCQLEDEVLPHMFEAMELDWPDKIVWEIVKQADIDACSAEWVELGMDRKETWVDRLPASDKAIKLTRRFACTPPDSWISDGIYLYQTFKFKCVCLKETLTRG